jgi:hypothetical protein
MKFKLKGASLAVIVPALALAAPAFAQVRNTTLSDSEEPGSVIVFPKFINAPAVTLPESTRDVTVTAPVTELEIGVVCPKGVVCPEHEPVKIRFHWVCGTTEANVSGSFICQEVDFDVTATVFEKIVLVPDGTPQNGYTSGLPTKTIPAAPCGSGYLIGWVITPTSDTPIKFDGLIGDAVLRPGSGSAGSPTAEAGYDAIPIQADPALASGAAITTNSNGGLIFDGAAGHYQAVTGQVMGDIRYTNLTTGPTFVLGSLTLLTLDVHSNRPNNPVFVDLDFFGGNPSAIGNENQLSTSTEFICWEEIPITALTGGADLTTTLMGRKGVFVSDQAVKQDIFGIPDDTGNVTLLGLAETLEGGTFPGNPTATSVWPRASFSGLFNSSVPVPTHFTPTPSPNLLP